MADATTTAEQSSGATATRLSPKGGGGRVTVGDVEHVLNDRASGPTGRASATERRPRATAASLLVRRLLGEGGFQPSEVVGTGTGDRVIRDDAARAVEAARAQAEPASGRTTSVRRAAEAPVPGDEAAWSETVELSRAGRTIAERMHESLRTTAQLTACTAVRDRMQRHTGVPLMPLAPIAHALCRALGRDPLPDASIELEEGTATYHRDVHLGIAVDTDHRLVVSTVRRAQELTAAAPLECIADLAARAGSGDLAPDEGGGTITNTNTRSRRVMLDTTILDPPQVGILATTRIEKRPVVIADDLGGDPLAIHQMSYLCLTYDHRSVDGADAVLVLTDLKQELETADLLGCAA